MMPAPEILRLHPADDVAVATRPLAAGTQVVGEGVQRPIGIIEAIPAGHKVALVSIAEGAPVRKYGQVIGFADADIAAGAHIHTHNLTVRDFERDYAFCVDARPIDLYPPEQRRTFHGYLRPDGRVGTRNYIAVISSVNCSASVSQYVAARFRTDAFRRDFPHVDGVIAFTHKGGCGVQPGEPLEILQRVLVGMALHPNVFGYVLIGLGCEINQIDLITRNFGLDSQDRIRLSEARPSFLSIQEIGGTARTVEAAVEAVSRLLPAANTKRRSMQPLSRLILAENCGGSDAHSGITANPALGVASDTLIRHGGTSVLAETPEIYGAEHLLTRRAISRAVGEQLIDRLRWWEDHVRQFRASIDNNPSWGNKQGGLTTIYEKSLGAVAKGGQAPLSAVYRYAEQVNLTGEAPGLCFMDTPGYDPVSMTGLVAGGCTVGVFTTGRGSVYGCKPVPSIKVATTTALFERMPDDMDLNAGTILDGTETVAQVGERLFETILAVASGEQRTKSELAGVGDEEFAPWMLGPTF